MMGPDRVRGSVFLTLGLGLVIAAGGVANGTRGFLNRSRIAPGVVIARPYGPHHVRIRFVADPGVAVTYHQNGLVALDPGQRVAVRYDPRDPAHGACVDQWPAIWGTAIVVGLFGLAFTVAGVCLWRLARTERFVA